MSLGKRICFWILGGVGAIFALTHLYSLITASYDRPEMSLAWVGVGAFLIYTSVKKLRTKKVEKNNG